MLFRSTTSRRERGLFPALQGQVIFESTFLKMENDHVSEVTRATTADSSRGPRLQCRASTRKNGKHDDGPSERASQCPDERGEHYSERESLDELTLENPQTSCRDVAPRSMSLPERTKLSGHHPALWGGGFFEFKCSS